MESTTFPNVFESASFAIFAASECAVDCLCSLTRGAVEAERVPAQEIFTLKILQLFFHTDIYKRHPVTM
jgi:hypothetical protein